MLSEASRNPPTEAVRSDLAPLLRRFPALGQPVRAVWQSGTTGDDRVPGPTTYWIDAVVTLSPDTAARLRQTHSLTSSAEPAATPGVAAAIPAGVSWLTGRDLAVELSGDGWGCRAFLAADGDTLVLLGTGDR